MHGFFMEMKTYLKLRALSKPFEYEEYMKKKIKDKIEEKRQKRILPQKRLPKINRELAAKLSKSKNDNMIDERFAEIFEREEFQQDENSSEYILRNPSKGMNRKLGGGDDSEDDLQGLYEKVDDDNSEGSDEAEDNGGDDFDDEYDDIAIYNTDQPQEKKARRPRPSFVDDSYEEEGQIISASKKKSPKPPKMYEISEGVASSKALFRYTADEKGKLKADRSEGSLSLYDRIQSEISEADSKLAKVKTVKTTKGIVLESSYTPKEVSKQQKPTAKARNGKEY
jgi:hypothetical protein